MQSKIKDRKVILSTLWIFFILNILYADVIGLMENIITDVDISNAKNGELVQSILSPVMLLVISIILELGMVMIILSRILKHAVNRWANVVIAIIQALVLIASLFVGTPKMYYIFFATVELTTLLFIVWYAWTWPLPVANKLDFE
jgi:hypothetical protein